MGVHSVLPRNLKLQQPQLPRSGPNGQPPESSHLELTWWHVGRFLHLFAGLEISANELFAKLFNLNATFFLLLVPQLDLSKRLDLVRLALRRKDVNVKALFLHINAVIEVRNVVAHSAFDPDLPFDPDDDGAKDHGVLFDYVSKTGETKFSERVQKLVGGRPDESYISYHAFELLDGKMRRWTEQLWELAGACVPLSEDDFDDETLQGMRDVLNRNVIPLKPNEN